MKTLFARFVLVVTLLVSVTAAANAGSHQQGHGPDAWRVHGVASHDHLNARVGPGTSYFVIDALPYNARGIQVSYCTPTVTQQQFYGLTYQQQQRLNQYSAWCLVTWNGYQRGWVNRRFLAEDAY